MEPKSENKSRSDEEIKDRVKIFLQEFQKALIDECRKEDIEAIQAKAARNRLVRDLETRKN
jgi:hypothetical protein